MRAALSNWTLAHIEGFFFKGKEEISTYRDCDVFQSNHFTNFVFRDWKLKQLCKNHLYIHVFSGVITVAVCMFARKGEVFHALLAISCVLLGVLFVSLFHWLVDPKMYRGIDICHQHNLRALISDRATKTSIRILTRSGRIICCKKMNSLCVTRA